MNKVQLTGGGGGGGHGGAHGGGGHGGGHCGCGVHGTGTETGTCNKKNLILFEINKLNEKKQKTYGYTD